MTRRRPSPPRTPAQQERHDRQVRELMEIFSNSAFPLGGLDPQQLVVDFETSGLNGLRPDRVIMDDAPRRRGVESDTLDALRYLLSAAERDRIDYAELEQRLMGQFPGLGIEVVADPSLPDGAWRIESPTTGLPQIRRSAIPSRNMGQTQRQMLRTLSLGQMYGMGAQRAQAIRGIIEQNRVRAQEDDYDEDEEIPLRQDPNQAIGMYGKLEGKRVVPATHEEAEAFFTRSERIIGKTPLPRGYWISTIFLGINHAFGPRSIWFESVVFDKNMNEQEQQRYSTYDEAEAGHLKLTREWLTELSGRKYTVDEQTEQREQLERDISKPQESIKPGQRKIIRD